ncbi:unnamed protein product [Rotaria sp. Silwood2]|nr:unnamed protein product [Rotaria sp. Silwood2]
MVIIQTLFKRIRYNKDINRQTINRWLMNINMILRCLVQNLTEDAKLTQWNDVVSSVNLTRDEMFSVALLHILHDAVLQILTNTRQLPTEQIKTGFYQSQKSLSFHHNRYDKLEAQRMVIIQTLFKCVPYNKGINRQTINRWLMNKNMILRCLVQNLTEDAKLTQWNDVVSSVNLTRDEMFSVAFLHILHDVVLQILTNTRQSRGQMDMILVSLASDYRYLFMYIMKNGKSLLDIYSTQLTLFDVVSLVELRPIDPFVVAFRALDINRQTRNRWLMNINMILRCLVQNLTEDAKLIQWNDVVASVILTRDEMFSVALLHILHDVVLQILTNTRQLCGPMDMILVTLASDYRYLFMYIMENGNQSKQ